MAGEAEKTNNAIKSTHDQIEKLLEGMSKAKDPKIKKGFATQALKEVAKSQKLQAQLNLILAKEAQ